MRTSGASIVAFTTLSAALHLKPPVHHHHLRGGAVSCLATTYDAAFPEGFDPNYYPADARTYASVAGTATAPAIDRELNKLLPTFDFDFNRLIRDANLPDRTHRIPSRTAIPSARRARTIHKLSRSPGGAGCSRLTLGAHPRATSPRPPRRGLPPTVWLCP